MSLPGRVDLPISSRRTVSCSLVQVLFFGVFSALIGSVITLFLFTPVYDEGGMHTTIPGTNLPITHQPSSLDERLAPLPAADTGPLAKSLQSLIREVSKEEAEHAVCNAQVPRSSYSEQGSGDQKSMDILLDVIRTRKLRVYVYDMPDRFNSMWYLHKSNKRMIEVEKRVHDIMRMDGVATLNPEAADLFYVPIYPVGYCTHQKYSCRTWNEHQDCYGCHQGRRLIYEAIEWLKEKPYFRRNEARDHIWPFFYDFGVCMETFEKDAKRSVVPELIRESIFLSFLGDPSTGCYRPDRDIVLPPYVEDVSETSEAEVEATGEILVYFRGSAQKEKVLRTRLLELYRDTPGSIITTEAVSLQQTHAEMQRARFCLVVPGFAPWTYRAIEVVHFNCVPVFIGDMGTLPFQRIIDYTKIGFVEDASKLDTLLVRLASVPEGEIRRKKQYMARVKPLFSYYSDIFVEMLMLELALKADMHQLWKRPQIRPHSVNFEVDLVYTWVDGHDPAWRAKKAAAMGEAKGHHVREDASMNMRFQDREELRFSLRSVEQNLPWVRHIYIVVCCNQVPKWLNADHPKVTMVQHEEIFPTRLQDVLPTFNSFAIECFVDRIPGLSEHFLLMNDDFFFGRPLKKSLFYTPEGLPRVSFQDNWFRDHATCRGDLTGASAKHSYLWAALNTFREADNAFGAQPRYLVLHEAYPLTKTVYRRARAIFESSLMATARTRFRSTKNVVPHFLALYTGFHEGLAIPVGKAQYPTNMIVQVGDNLDENRMNYDVLKKGEYELFCMGDMLSDDAPFSKVVQVANSLKKWLHSMFPRQSDYEKQPFEESDRGAERQPDDATQGPTDIWKRLQTGN